MNLLKIKTKNALFKQRILPAIFLSIGLIVIFIIFRLSFYTFSNFNWGNSSNIGHIFLRISSLILYGVFGFWAFYELSFAFTKNKNHAIILSLFQQISILLGINYLKFIFGITVIQENFKLVSFLFNIVYNEWIFYVILVMNALIFALIRLITIKDINYVSLFLRTLVYLLVSFLIASFFRVFVFLMFTHSGLSYIIILSAGAIASDIGGFFVGIKLGNKYFKNKLAPTISPKKTWEGFIGGFICSFLVVFTLIISLNFIDLSSQKSDKNYFNILFTAVQKPENSVYLSRTSLVLFTLFIPIISTIGDLSFSMIKRWNEIKDFSKILRGHGGILDRIDSIIFVFIFFSLITIVF
ncbi:phosphatidate cytidylyltransferase [Mycoplasmopsis citelli]|uniref:phosphatidate cytidylyltransferase n=1 Tax=Mycoplasmopsis citelli TaxID=171281 RepID=UPI00211451C7|nr:phosphatidate cytidylyltransferase [Mycoplasmopsis citelli]UUD36202.1 phosphatidate cytidylyltransferase [Mycoplasmopsis citelli]